MVFYAKLWICHQEAATSALQGTTPGPPLPPSFQPTAAKLRRVCRWCFRSENICFQVVWNLLLYWLQKIGRDVCWIPPSWMTSLCCEMGYMAGKAAGFTLQRNWNCFWTISSADSKNKIDHYMQITSILQSFQGHKLLGSSFCCFIAILVNQEKTRINPQHLPQVISKSSWRNLRSLLLFGIQVEKCWRCWVC